MTEVLMPQLSEQMEQGTIVSWLVEDGQHVAVGDELVEIETDKATMAYVSEVEGVVDIVVEVGTTLAIGGVMARIGDDDGADAGRGEELPALPRTAALTAQTATSKPIPRPAAGRTAATPVAARVADIHGIDLGALSGTGPLGRITKQDVLRAAGIEELHPGGRAPPATTPSTVDGNGQRGTTTVRQPSSLERVIARRMAEAKATIPHFQVETEVMFDAAIELRATLKADGASLSLNDVVVLACARTLRDHPRVNASYVAERFEFHSAVNVGVAVATDRGLLVVTVLDTDRKSLAEIARETRRLSDRARSGEITPSELAGATFTVSNLGMYGMTALTPVINPPQAAILGVGTARPVLARATDGAIIDRQLLTLTLSADHRILNGAEAARFLSDVRRYLEEPLTLLL